jgi:hypothetical protein
MPAVYRGADQNEGVPLPLGDSPFSGLHLNWTLDNRRIGRGKEA